MTKLTLSLFALGFAGWAGCTPEYQITEQPLMGQLAGLTWSVGSGETDAFLSQDDDYFALLYADSFTPCNMEAPQGVDHLILNLPKEVGEWELGPSRTMTFVVQQGDGPLNLISNEGKLRVDSITDDTIAGGIHAVYDADNEVDGTFTVAICP